MSKDNGRVCMFVEVITPDTRYWNPIKETAGDTVQEAQRLFDEVYLPARVAGERGGRPYRDNLAYLSTHRHQIDYTGPWDKPAA